MDHLWAPWRHAYIASAKPPSEYDACFICRGLAESNDRGTLIVERQDHTVVMLNRFPYNNGHLLVAPRAHKGELTDLLTEEILEVHRTLTRMVGLLDKLMQPEGYNIGLNLGRPAGAGLPGHLHWHV